MAFNLFDFSQETSATLNPFWASVWSRPSIPAPYARPKAQVDAEVATNMRKKNVPTAKPAASAFFNTASADEWLSDDEIKTLIDEGYSDEEIQQADDELRWSTISEPVSETSVSLPERTMQSVGGTIGNVVGWAVAEVPNIASNLLTFASGAGSAIRNPLSPIEGFKSGVKTANELGIASAGESASGFVKKYGAYEPESTGAKVGEIGAQIGASATIPGWALGKWYKAAGLAGKVLRAWAQGAIETGKFTAVSEWRLPTATEASIWAGISAALPVVGKALQATKTKLQLSGNVNPAKLAQIRDSIISEGADASDDVVKKVSEWQKKPELVSQWMLDRGVTGTKEQMIEKLVNVGESSKKTVDDALASVPTKFKSQSASSALASLKKSVEWVEGMEPVLARIDDLAKRNKTTGLTLSELNQVKREMDRNLSMFTIAGDVKAGNVKQGLANIRSDLRKFIETKADEAGIPNVRSLNNETSVSHRLAEAIGKKEDADAIRQLVSPFSGGMLGGLTWVWPFDNNSIEGKAGNFLFGALVGSAANSSFLKTKIASGINKMTPSEKWLVNAFIESRGTNPVPKVLKDVVSDVSKSPLPKSANKPLISIKSEVLKSKSLPIKNAPKQPLRNAGTADEAVSLTKEATKTLKGGFLNRGGYVKLPGSDVKKVDKLNTWDEIVLIRGTWKPMDSATASYSQAYWEWLYLTDDVKTAQYYWSDIKETKIRNSDIFDTEKDLIRPKAISEVIKEAERVTGRKTNISKSPQTYDRLRRDLYGDIWLDDQEVSKIINSVLKKNWFQWIRYDIGRVNDELSGNAFVIFENKSPILKPKPSK